MLRPRRSPAALRHSTYARPFVAALPGSENCGMKPLMIVIALVALAACRQEGPVEKAGRQVDQAGEKAARSIEKAGENVRDAVNGKK